MFKHIFSNVAVACFALTLVPMGTARAATILVDDFNDGNDNGWYCPFLPTCDPSSYAYHFQNQDFVAPPGAVGSFWSNSEQPLFSSGLLRVSVRNDAPGTVAGPTMRNSPTANYSFLADSLRKTFYIGRYVRDGSYREHVLPGMSYISGEEWFIEGGIVGDQLSMKVWRLEDPEPESPQLVVTDAEPLPSQGSDLGFGLLSYVNRGTPSAQIDATFDDVYFTHIPASGILEDFNGDGTVNFPDFLQFGDAYGSTRTSKLVLFDLDMSGEVDFADFLQFGDAYGQVAQASAVPEPNSLMLTAVGLLLFSVLRQRHRSSM